MPVPTFVDEVVLHVTAGNGGNGVASVHREKFKPLGGPDGGNGGRGGDVVLVVDPDVTTLLDYHHAPHRRATSGRPGQGAHRHGADGEDLVLPVPDGTVVKTRDGEVLADLVGAGTRFVVAAGGRGGLGNAALASTRRKAPGFALLGEPGEVLDVVLELKTVADVGLVGYPSAGKSSLVAALSAARPKIAEYPFTTLVPNLGVVTAGEVVFTVADVPGLIPGASEGKGLGLDFLRHVERCAVLVHVLDCATLEPGRDPISDLEALDHELRVYGAADRAERSAADRAERSAADRAGRSAADRAGRSAATEPRSGYDAATEPRVSDPEATEPHGKERGLAERARIVALNKIDVPEARELAELVRPDLEQRGFTVVEVSAASHEGLRELAFAMGRIVARVRAERAAEAIVPTRVILRPKAVDEVGFTVTAEPDGYRVRGDKPERWVRQTDFTNDEAVGYLADRLARLGVEDALAAAGARAGDTVMIGPPDDAVVFDWEPTLRAGAEHLFGRRGSDARLAARRPSAIARSGGRGAEQDDGVGDDELDDQDPWR